MRSSKISQVVGVICLVASGCSGNIEHEPGKTGNSQGGGSGGGGTAGNNSTVSLPPLKDDTTVATTPTCSMANKPVSQEIRRLSVRQYRRTLNDLLTSALGDAAAGVQTKLAATIELIPDDAPARIGSDPHGTFRRLSQEVRADFVEGSYKVAETAADLLTAPDLLAKFVGSCATAMPVAADCTRAFVEKFGRRVLRHPLTAGEVDRYVSINANSGLKAVITALLSAPGFLYLLEHGDKAADGAADVFVLTPFEVASRLSYQFWDTMPDDTLWKAAETGSLLTSSGYAAEVERIFADPRTRDTMDMFFLDWLMLDELPKMDTLNADPEYKAFAGDALPSAKLTDDMAEELLSMGRHLTFNAPGTFNDLLTSDLVFPRSVELARLYGLSAAWDGKSAPPALAKGARPGYLTRAGMLASGMPRTRPVLRGALLRTKTFCEAIPPPPADAADEAEKVKDSIPAGASTREVTISLTEKVAASCKGCHQVFTNPLGFALEGFDGLGRARTVEKVLDSKGKLIKEVPVDTRAIPRVDIDDETTEVSGAGELVAVIAKDKKVASCFARNYVRYSNARVEDLTGDACALNLVTSGIDKGAKLPELFRSIALVPSFKLRTISVKD
jgi:hypothetical protein